MKKRMLCFLAVLIPAILLAACSSPAPSPAPEAPSQAEAQPEPVTYDLEKGGVSFDLPAQLQNLKGVLYPCYGMEYGSGSGIYLSGLCYYAFSRDKYNELAQKGGGLSAEEQAFIGSRMIDVLDIFAVDGNRGVEALTEILASAGQSASDYALLGTVGEYNFFYSVNPNAGQVDSSVTFDEGFREDFASILPVLKEPGWIRIYEPKKTALSDAGTAVAFDALDLDGNPVSSADIFSRNKLTVINIWGTFCGPCINEMPDLEVLNGRLAEKGCEIIGIVCDVSGSADTKHIEDAKEIISDTGVSYLNLIPWDGFDEALPAEYIPTTYFVDSEGRLVGEPAVGSRGADEYEALIDAVLAGME